MNKSELSGHGSTSLQNIVCYCRVCSVASIPKLTFLLCRCSNIIRCYGQIKVGIMKCLGSACTFLSVLCCCSFDEITVHGLGMAIHRAINLALQLQEKSPYQLQIIATTSTVYLVDELEPLCDVCNHFLCHMCKRWSEVNVQGFSERKMMA